MSTTQISSDDDGIESITTDGKTTDVHFNRLSQPVPADDEHLEAYRRLARQAAKYDFDVNNDRNWSREAEVWLTNCRPHIGLYLSGCGWTVSQTDNNESKCWAVPVDSSSANLYNDDE